MSCPQLRILSPCCGATAGITVTPQGLAGERATGICTTAAASKAPGKPRRSGHRVDVRDRFRPDALASQLGSAVASWSAHTRIAGQQNNERGDEYRNGASEKKDLRESR
jgi:hypothetical protein